MSSQTSFWRRERLKPLIYMSLFDLSCPQQNIVSNKYVKKSFYKNCSCPFSTKLDQNDGQDVRIRIFDVSGAETFNLYEFFRIVVSQKNFDI